MKPSITLAVLFMNCLLVAKGLSCQTDSDCLKTETCTLVESCDDHGCSKSTLKECRPLAFNHEQLEN